MAQKADLVVFTQSGEPFNLILNGIRQSPQPVTNIRITDLHMPSYKVTIQFRNERIPDVNKTIYLQQETEATYEILKNRKGAWVMRLMNQAEVTRTPVPKPKEEEQVVFVYSPTPRVSTTTISQSTTVNAGVGMPFGTSVTTTTSQTTTTVEGSHGRPGGEPGNHGDDRGHHGGEVQQRGDDRGHHGEGNDREGYSGPTGCRKPMSDRDFEQVLKSISSKNFESSKMTVAKQVAAANCLRCTQVKEIMKGFDFESTRLEFAKYAYKFTWDLKNYYLLNDAFQFESSIEELSRYIEGEQ